MITCPKCSKENQDHYKFCLGCGAELPRDAAPKKFPTGRVASPVRPASGAPIVDESTSVGGTAQGKTDAPPPPPLAPPPPKPAAAAPTTAAPPAPAPAAPTTAVPPAPAPVSAPPPLAAVAAPPPITEKPVVEAAPAPKAAIPAGQNVCPQCSQPNPLNNKFCASCGFKLTKPVAAAPAAEPTPAPGPSLPPAALLTALRADGTEAGSFTLPAGGATVGRDTGGVFAGDSYMSPRHSTFSVRNGKLYVRDENSLNGVYKKLRREEPVLVGFGEIFRIGQEIIRFEPLVPQPPTADGIERLGSPSKGYVGRIALVTGRETTGNAFPVPEMGLHLGRERGDVLFPEDGYVSGLHCRIAWQNGQLFLTDLGSSNGTFLRISKETEVQNGDVLLMGQQLFRITI